MLDFLVTFGVMTLVMSMVITLLLLLQKSIKKRFTPLSRYIIWAVIVIRLCIPVGAGLFPELFTVTVTEQPEPLIITEDYQDKVLSELVLEGRTEYIPPSVEAYVEENPELHEENKSFELTREDVLSAVFTLWISGAVIFVTVTLIRYFISISRLRRGLGTPAAELMSVYDSVCEKMGIRRKPKLYISSRAASPMVYGFLRTRVLLPDMEIAPENLEHIIMHELVHYKRGDLYFKLAAMLANALHWYNPLVYIACRRMSDEAELSCDAAVLSKTDLTGRLDYGNSMLEIVKHCKVAPELTTGFNPKKKAVKERFENIIDTSKRKKAVAILIAVIVVALVCTGIIGCTTKYKSGVVQGLDDVTVEQQEETPQTQETDYNHLEEQRLKEGIFHVHADQWRGESEDWRFYYDFDAEALVLEHSDGRRFAYGNAAEGVCGISPVYNHADSLYARGYVMNEKEGVLFYQTKDEENMLPRINAMVIDLTDGNLLGSVSYGTMDILSANGITEDKLKPYRMAAEFIGDRCYFGNNYYTLYNDSCDSIPLYTSVTTTYGDISCVTEFDRQSRELSEIKASESTFVDTKYCNDISKAHRLTNSGGEKAAEEEIELLADFLEGDTASLEAKAGYQKGLLDIYSTLEFGEYLIEVSDYGAVLYVDIIKSGIDGIEPGIHRFACGIMRNLEGQRYIYHICEHGSVTTDDYGNIGLITGLMNFSHRIDVPYGDNYKDSDLWSVLSLLYYEFRVYSPEDMTDKAKEVFGIELDLSSYTSESIKEGVQNFGYKKSKTYLYRELELADDHITLVFYADYGCTVPAFKMKYPIRTQPSKNPNVLIRDMFFDGPSIKYDETGKEAISY